MCAQLIKHYNSSWFIEMAFYLVYVCEKSFFTPGRYSTVEYTQCTSYCCATFYYRALFVCVSSLLLGCRCTAARCHPPSMRQATSSTHSVLHCCPIPYTRYMASSVGYPLCRKPGIVVCILYAPTSETHTYCGRQHTYVTLAQIRCKSAAAFQKCGSAVKNLATEQHHQQTRNKCQQ